MFGKTDWFRLGILFCLAAAVMGCAGRLSVIGSAPPVDPSAPSSAAAVPADSSALEEGAPASEDPRFARYQAETLWAGRGHPDTARLALEAYERLAGAGTDPILLARLARAYYLVANYVEAEPARKDSLFLKGVEAAERAMASHPEFRKVYAETKDEKKAVLKLDAQYLDAIYWYAANLGKWAANKSLMVRLGNKSKLEAFNKRVLDLDETYFHAAPHRFFGALPTRVPGGDLNLAKKHFEKALALEPNYFGTRTLYAEYYAVKARDKDTFHKQLDYVLNTAPGSLSDAEPENRYEQEIARKLKERAHEWFD